jgi:hypothetical protein
VPIFKRPAYVTRQKEQQRRARATERREARRARKHSTGTEIEDPETQDPAAGETETGEEAGI